MIRGLSESEFRDEARQTRTGGKCDACDGSESAASRESVLRCSYLPDALRTRKVLHREINLVVEIK
jgi:hypothetical protein